MRLLFVLLAISLYAKVVDKIEIVVNDVPITSYDIEKITQKLNDRQKAIAYLIEKAILDSAIKKRGIYVDEFDIDKAMQKIAQQNGMSLFNFKTYLLQKGELDTLKAKLKQEIQKQKLISTLNIRVSQKEIEHYYQKNKKLFVLPKYIKTIQYSSNNRDSLLEVIKNPLSNRDDVTIQNIKFEYNKTPPKLYNFLAQNSNFTPIVNIEGKWVSFYIENIGETIQLPYKKVEAIIYQKLISQKTTQALTEFIAKLKAKADIKKISN
jgi:hypothetical protein